MRKNAISIKLQKRTSVQFTSASQLKYERTRCAFVFNSLFKYVWKQIVGLTCYRYNFNAYFVTVSFMCVCHMIIKLQTTTITTTYKTGWMFKLILIILLKVKPDMLLFFVLFFPRFDVCFLLFYDLPVHVHIDYLFTMICYNELRLLEICLWLFLVANSTWSKCFQFFCWCYFFDVSAWKLGKSDWLTPKWDGKK